MTKKIGDYDFSLAGRITPLSDERGGLVEYSYSLPARIRPNRYASGPFCTFILDGATTGPGVYAITVNAELRYIGRCENLADRFGRNGYGHIDARNCHSDGQATNCKVNGLILKAARERAAIAVWFYRTTSKDTVERRLIGALNPPWNGRRKEGSGATTQTLTASLKPPTAADFRLALTQILGQASHAERRSVRVLASELHRKVGNYPGPNHRMPTCCSVMKSSMAEGDRQLQAPPSGQGPTLLIEYRIPRQ
jgi:hypothetical protein